ncbi:MAG: DUF305 domain-containing protein [Alphaproteobacteria bacterium]|nr:DUF305 domain-containing protein [Alphaproteobacteria bacterium]
MKKTAFIITLGLAVFCISPGVNASVEKQYKPSQPQATTPWYGLVGNAERKADLDFVAGMRPHHAGALSMSRDYLESPSASNDALKSLARGIIKNQEFEIVVLDSIEHFMAPPVHDTGAEGKEWRQVAAEGQVQKKRFFRAPMPSYWGGGDDRTVSARDVQFAKAMIIHHQAAVDMAHDYLRNPAGANGYLRQMCKDIILDQEQEIALMNRIIAAFPGDADSVHITPDMIHGMEGMTHGHNTPPASANKSHHGHHE